MQIKVNYYLLICKHQYSNSISNIVLHANKYIIRQSSKIKVLGIFIASGLSNNATVNNIISKVNFSLSVLKEVSSTQRLELN